MTNNVVRIEEWKTKKDLEGVLEELLGKTRRGELTGLILGLRFGQWNHGIAVVGDGYEKDLVSALGVAGRIFISLNKEVDKLTRKKK